MYWTEHSDTEGKLATRFMCVHGERPAFFSNGRIRLVRFRRSVLPFGQLVFGRGQQSGRFFTIVKGKFSK